MFKKLAFFVLAMSVVPSLTHGQDKGLRVISRSHYVFENTNCEETASCSLKEAEFLVEDYRQSIAGENGSEAFHYGTRLVAKYRTDSLASLEDYVFVQFIKGCVFQSKIQNGTITYQYISTPQYDGIIEFKFKDWIIDSLDNDPVYNSIPGESRHAAYRWNTAENSFSPETEKFYGHEKPELPQLYVKDRSVSATTYTDGRAQNVSLDLKICIYKANEVPESIPDNINFAKPIYCHHRSSSFVYNHESAKFEYPNQIVPACR